MREKREMVVLTLPPRWKMRETESETCRLQKTSANKWWEKLKILNSNGKREKINLDLGSLCESV